MALNTLNTRIVLRNDDLASWNGSVKTLLKGEAALARRSDGNYEIRIGDGTKTWSQLSATGRLVFDASNVDGLTYSEYQLSALDAQEGEQSRFQLVGKLAATGAWTALGEPVAIPEVDFSEVNAAIAQISGTQIPGLKTELNGNIAAVSADTLSKAKSYADQSETDAVTASKAYSNQLSTALSADYAKQIKEIKDSVSDGIHFIGHVASKTDDGKYKVTAGGADVAAKNGDLIIVEDADGNGVEYIWSQAKSHWDVFGDEGNSATKQYVDDAKDAAVAACTNSYVEATELSGLSKEGRVKGDVGVVKTLIADGKYQYTAYVWDGAQWTAMDGNYNAENVYFNEDLTYTAGIGALAKPSGSATLPAKGKSLEDVLKSILAKEENPTVTKPSISLTASGKTLEYGTTYKVPSATLKLTGVGSYTYGPATGITVPVGSAKVTSSDGATVSNTTAMTLNQTLALAEGASKVLTANTTYTYTAEASHTQGAVPVTNIGTAKESLRIAAAKLTASASAAISVYKPCIWKVTTASTANPTAIDASTASAGGWNKQNGVKTSFACPANWYEIFCALPAGTKKSWTGKDSNNITLDTSAALKSVTVTYLNGDTGEYDLFVVRNAAAYSATTATMTFA